MAVKISDNQVRVESGDSLYGIAAKFMGGGQNYPTLASINGIKLYTKNGVTYGLIYPGQILNLSANAGSGGGSSSTSTPAPATRVTITNGPALISELENELFVTWDWANESNTDKYKVVWTYDRGDGYEWEASNTEISVDHDVRHLSRQHTIAVPDGAKIVKVKIKPIAIKDKNGDNEVARFQAQWSETKSWTVDRLFDAPGQPSAELDEETHLVLTVSLTEIDLPLGVNKVEFQLVKNNTTEVDKQRVTINTEFDYVSHVWNLDYDGKYKVRCRFVKDSIYSEWSSYSGEVTTPPVAPEGISTLRALSKSSVYVEWPAVNTATGYEIQYTTNVEYFDSNASGVQTVTVGSQITHTEITDMPAGDEYFFRLAAKGAGDIRSEWTEIKSIIIGTVPIAPTTWSSATTVIVGEPLTLYWVHNCEDGSKWTYAEVRLFVDGVQVLPDHTVKNTVTEEDKEDTVGSFEINTSHYPEGTKIDWQVHTAGITLEYGEWSTPRTVDIYTPPELELSVTDINGGMVDILTTFPFYVRALAKPKTQAPLSYHLSVISNDVYETVDAVGNPKMISKGEEVYSKHFDTNENPLMVELSASNIDLENNAKYTLVCTAAMDSGLVAESSKDFTVSWTEIGYTPNARIGINTDTLSAQIQPYCQAITVAYHKVALEGDLYVVTDETVSGVFTDPTTDPVITDTTTTGERVYYGTFPDGTKGYYCTVETRTMVEGVSLAVYRREFDGTFTEIAKGVKNTENIFVVDPHPALDYARYRIVATADNTGAVCYYDVPGYPVGHHSVVIQWNEDWSNFDASNDDALAQPPWSGSMLKLPYNIDVSDNSKPDVALIEYIGRTHPISYYGTQTGQTSTWNVTIEKSDKETLYALRRLAIWMGDVYVREPSGSGYWANITVSFSQKHKDLTIPVSLTITRVEGGV